MSPVFQSMFDEELLGPITNALSGGQVDASLIEHGPTLDVWNPERWALPGAMPREIDPLRRLVTEARFEDDGDPAHAQADERAKQIGVDVRAPDTDLLSIARSQLGAPYIWADMNPVGTEGGLGSGFDCSGFTMWVLSRFGIQTQHMASLQQQQFRSVGREELQPGDLVFMAIPGGNWKGPDTASHVGMYIGNGQMIDASSSNNAIVEREVMWEYFIGGGATGISGEVSPGEAPPVRPRDRDRIPVRRGEEPVRDLMSVPLELTGAAPGMPTYGDASSALVSLLMPERQRGRPQSFKGEHGAIEQQLYQGFMDAGREDLAQMVGTPQFSAWIGAESGWNPGVTSPANNHGLANDGLFQIWRGHDYNANGQVASMSPYQQALLVAEHFAHLTPEAIRQYAAQVANGTYSGWG